jgi:hypothetical protein
VTWWGKPYETTYDHDKDSYKQNGKSEQGNTILKLDRISFQASRGIQVSGPGIREGTLIDGTTKSDPSLVGRDCIILSKPAGPGAGSGQFIFRSKGWTPSPFHGRTVTVWPVGGETRNKEFGYVTAHWQDRFYLADGKIIQAEQVDWGR